MLKVEPIGARSSVALARLREHRVLGAATEAELDALLRRAQLVRVPEREVLFRRGDPGRAVAIVLTGFVKLSSVEAGGREVVLEICGPGSLFGELACLAGSPRAADAIALADCEILSIPGEALRTALLRSPEAMLALVGVLIRRLRNATEQLRD